MSDTVADKIRAMQERLAFRSAYSRRKPAPPEPAPKPDEAAGDAPAEAKSAPAEPAKSRGK